MRNRRRRARRRYRFDHPLLIAGAALGAVLTVHVWGWVVVSAALGAVAYGVGRRHEAARARRSRPAGRSAATWRLSVGSACAGNQHELCRDRMCNCPCGHPARQPRISATPDEPPF